ncbi:hypothetical protein [Shimia sp.]
MKAGWLREGARESVPVKLSLEVVFAKKMGPLCNSEHLPLGHLRMQK